MRIIVDGPSLLAATDYRGFLLAFYESNKKNNPQFSYSYLAKKCSFSSKSFLKEVIDGKKNLTYESCAKILNGLSLPQNWKNYLESLIELEIASAESEKILIKKNLALLRQKLQQKKPVELKQNAGLYFKDKKWPYVYAALGNTQDGATLDQIRKRTRFSEMEIQRTLDFLLANNLVVKKEMRYLPLENTNFFAELGQSPFFQNFFLQSILNTGDRAQKKFDSKQDLFFSMSFSVNSQKMAQFKTELAELLDRYTQSTEDPEGDRVAELVCGFSLI